MRWRDFYREKAPWKVDLPKPWKDVVHPMPEDIARLVRDWLEQEAERADNTTQPMRASAFRTAANIFHEESFHVG